MTFLSLVVHNVTVKKVRSILTAFAVAIGVLTVVTLGLVNNSLRTSELSILQVGRADFTVAQKSSSDILSSVVDQADVSQIRRVPGVGQAVGVLINTEKYNADNPLFIEIGIDPAEMAQFGVTILAGRAPAPTARHEALLGYRAAKNLHLGVGDNFTINKVTFKIVGLYRTGQALGDGGVIFPLISMQAYNREPNEVTLVFVQVLAGVNQQTVAKRIDQDFPQLTTVRTASQFGRADRSLQFINAMDSGSEVLAVGIGAVIVMSSMTMTFMERTREFGLLSAVGWPRRRVLGLMMSEAALIALVGAALGAALSVAATHAVEYLPSLRGVLHVTYTAGTFGRALYTAAAMVLLGATYPAARAAMLAPLEALRNE